MNSAENEGTRAGDRGISADALEQIQAQLEALRLAQAQAPPPPQQSAEFRVDSYRIPKLPTFFRSDPALWFMQVEVTLRNSRITSEATKADIVIAALDFEAIACLKDILSQDPPCVNRYQAIKDRIISTFSESAEANLRKLLKGQVQLDGKPSLVLNRLRNLNNGRCPDDVIKSIFMDHLPEHHRSILIAYDTADLAKLAEIADRLAENFTPSGGYISGVSTKPVPVQQTDLERLSDKVDTLLREISSLRKDVNVLREQSPKYRRGRSGSRDKSKVSEGGKSQKLCYAHQRYPDSPRSCKDWCEKYAQWKEKN